MCQNIRSRVPQIECSIAEVKSDMASTNLESQMEKGLEESPAFPDHKCTSTSLSLSESVSLGTHCTNSLFIILHGLTLLSHVGVGKIASMSQVN